MSIQVPSQIPSQTPNQTPAAPPRFNLFLERLILFLLPYFLSMTSDHDLAREEIVETLASYGARTRSEMLNAVQIIAFSFSALDVLAEATAIKEMSAATRLRYRGCANGLNRSCQQNEKTLAKRLACDLPDAPDPALDPALDPAGEPIDDMPQEVFEAMLQQAHAEIASYSNRLSGVRPATLPQPVPPSQPRNNMRSGGSAIMDAFAQMGMQVPAGLPIHHPSAA
jgi:hypothetical protein